MVHAMNQEKRFEPLEWIQIFEWIKKELPLNFSDDSEPVKLLSNSIELNRNFIEKGYELIEGKEVSIFGAGPELEKITSIEGQKIIVADKAVKYVMYKLGKIPHILVTDLDGIDGIDSALLKKIPLIVAHLHGDNIERALKFFSYLKNLDLCVLFTIQTDPFPPFFNLGGFTDGDRAVFVALFFGARKIEVYGIGEKSIPNNLSEIPPDIRTKKFWIGKKIIEWLACKDKRILIPLAEKLECSQFPWEAVRDENRS